MPKLKPPVEDVFVVFYSAEVFSVQRKMFINIQYSFPEETCVVFPAKTIDIS
jgi:hypothetical protein